MNWVSLANSFFLIVVILCGLFKCLTTYTRVLVVHELQGMDFAKASSALFDALANSVHTSSGRTLNIMSNPVRLW